MSNTDANVYKLKAFIIEKCNATSSRVNTCDEV